MDKQSILIFGAGRLQIPIIKKAHEEGYYTIVVTLDPNEPACKFADEIVKDDFCNESRMLEVAKQYKVIGVLTDQTDIPVRTMAYVSEKLGLPGNSYETACIFTDKFLMRERCKELGIETLAYKLCYSVQDAIDFFKHSQFKEVILKPIGNQGSKGIYNWFRPLAIVFLFVILLLFIVQKRRWQSYAALALPLVLTVFLIGRSAKERTGHFVYQAVSGGYNLAMSSFDEANGLVNFNGFGDPDNYICLPPGDYTYMERDSLLKRASVRWISEHPFKYVSQLPFKLAALYCEDTWTERVKPDMGFRVVLSKVEGNNLKIMELIVSLALKSIVYYTVLLLFFYYVWTNRRDLLRERNIYLLIPVLGTAVTVLFVITSRYHYPYLFAITIYAAAGLDAFIQNKLRKNSRKC